MLCGHSACGGVNAALGNSKIGVIDAWLLPLRALRARGKKALEGLGEKERVEWLVEENVREGVKVLRGNSNVIEAVKGRGLQVHGVVYDIASGSLREVDCKCEEGEEEAVEWAFRTGGGGH